MVQQHRVLDTGILWKRERHDLSGAPSWRQYRVLLHFWILTFQRGILGGSISKLIWLPLYTAICDDCLSLMEHLLNNKKQRENLWPDDMDSWCSWASKFLQDRVRAFTLGSSKINWESTVIPGHWLLWMKRMNTCSSESLYSWSDGSSERSDAAIKG